MATAIPSVPYTSYPVIRRNVDVAVIGNGPSAIALSFMLSGNRPFYSGKSHPIDFLTAKLSKQNTSLADQDLEYLSEGLEGRSANPVSLLFDQLLRPDADLGIAHPSVLSWQYDTSQQVQHIVLGRGCVGGSWANMPPDLQALSYAEWLELPGMSMQQWLHDRTDKAHVNTDDRALCGTIAQYYADYVHRQGLQKNFCSGVEVTQIIRTPVDEKYLIKPVQRRSVQRPSMQACCLAHLPIVYSDSDTADEDESLSDSDSVEAEIFRIAATSAPFKKQTSLVQRCRPDQPRWQVHGTCRSGQKVILYANELVLAVGSADNPRRLNVPGEDLPHVMYGCPSPSFLQKISDKVTTAEPLLVVGCGLTAADCVLLALKHRLPVIHVFRRSADDPMLAVNRMPVSVYPEYSHVGRLMSSCAPHDSSLHFDGNEESYIALAHHRVVSISDGCCVLKNNSEVFSVRCSHVFIAAGRQPDLSFLPPSCHNLTVKPDEEVNCRSNPLDVDPFTFESRRVPGLYAIGPLVGDNFVRFAIGGALGIAQSLLSRPPV